MTLRFPASRVVGYAQMLRAIAVAVLLGTPVMAGWERCFPTEPEDPPVCEQAAAHPLAYFKAPPSSRDGTEKEKFHTKLVPIGNVDSFAVYDLEYYSDDADDAGVPFAAESVLVQTATDEYHEIYATECCPPPGNLGRSAIVQGDGQNILVSSFWGGGAYEPGTVVYFVFGKDGPIRLDFTPVLEAALKVIPKDRSLWRMSDDIDFHSLVWSTETNKSNLRVGCCDGSVTVPFRITADGTVVPTNAEYNPRDQN